jgi:hypothetical protein
MIEYDLIINDTKAYYKLVGLCVLLFISLVVVWFTLLAFDLLILTETAIIIEVFIVRFSLFWAARSYSFFYYDIVLLFPHQPFLRVITSNSL